MFAIAGVSGNTGSVVADTLLAQGHKVRVIVRSADKGAAWRARGAEVAIASLEDPLALARAFEGVKGAYLLIPPDVTNPAILARGRRLTESFVEALVRSPVPHVVLLSSIGAQRGEDTGPIRAVKYAEERLRTVTRLTAIRAAYFLENLGSGIGPAREQGVLPALFSPDRELEMVSTRDIGRTAASALVEGATAHQIIELAGPERYTYARAAELLGKALKKEVKAVHVPKEQVVPALTSAGLSADMAGLFLEMATRIHAGELEFEGRHRTVRGQVTLADQIAQLTRAA